MTAIENQTLVNAVKSIYRILPDFARELRLFAFANELCLADPDHLLSAFERLWPRYVERVVRQGEAEQAEYREELCELETGLWNGEYVMDVLSSRYLALDSDCGLRYLTDRQVAAVSDYVSKTFHAWCNSFLVHGFLPGIDKVRADKLDHAFCRVTSLLDKEIIKTII